MWLNFHTHSTYCDGKSSLEDLVSKAKSLSMKWLGFSSHAPLPFDCTWCMKSEKLKEYLNKIATLKSGEGTEFYAGLEVDYIPGKIGPMDFPELDYTIGSIHFVESLPGGQGWEIDGPRAHFLEGLEIIFLNNIKNAVQRYLELTREMVTLSTPSIVGHLDKIKIQNADNKFFNEEDLWYREEIKMTLEAIARSGSIIEVNTRGLYQKKTQTPYPSPWVLELIAKKIYRL
ncbi:MAG TPA: histidinol-phosphatase, partial [Cyclobacteriaceae bacterium]|nr:histidinol-phosphatase [Cyclobacteriaceae bacterium]